jgi:hypothetical protein
MEHTYNFFILRYAPNRERGEQVNIGLVIDRDPLDIRITHDLRKAIAIDATRDGAQLLDLEAQIRQWTSGATKFTEVHQGLQGFGPITVSELGWFTCTAANYESNVDKIMREMVVPPARRPVNWAECPRCHETAEGPDDMEGCRDPQCPAIFGSELP